MKSSTQSKSNNRINSLREAVEEARKVEVITLAAETEVEAVEGVAVEEAGEEVVDVEGVIRGHESWRRDFTAAARPPRNDTLRP